MNAHHINKGGAAGPCCFVVFGANGDLTKRLLVPALYNLAATGLQNGQTSEQIAHVDFTGLLGEYGVKTPWAEDGVAINLGTEYRKERLELDVDNAFATGDLTGQGAPTLPIKGSFRVIEFFGEAQVPIVQRSFIHDLTLTAGYRRSYYETSGGSNFDTNTYKIGLEFAPIQDVRFRAGYNRAVRAPNVQELFAPQFVGLDGSEDPCADITIAATDFGCLAQGMGVGDSTPSNPAGQYNGLLGGNPEFMARQQAISAKRLASRVGRRIKVIIDEAAPTVSKGRSQWDAPEIDGSVYVASRRPLRAGEVLLSEDGQSVDARHVGYTVSPHEECAVELAIQVAAATGGEATVLTLGPAEALEQIRNAIAVGCTRGIVIEADPDRFGPGDVAAAIAQVVRDREAEGTGYDLVLLGNDAADTGDFQVGVRLAYSLQRPVLTGISTVEVSGDNVVATGDGPDGTEIFEVRLPAVVAVMEGGVEPRYPSVPGRMKAKRAPVDVVEPSVQPAGTGRVRLKLLPVQPSNVQILGEGPAAAPAVVDLLERIGVVSR